MCMRINLAREPFRNRRVWILGLGLLVCLGLGVGLNLAARRRSLARQTEALAELVRQQEGEIRRLRGQIPPPVAPEKLSPFEREALRSAAHLIERRLFPWSHLLRDLEQGLVANTRVTSIRVAPEESASGDLWNSGGTPARVSLTLIGRDLQDVLHVLERLRASGRFRNFRPKKQSLLEGTNEAEYELDVTYLPETRMAQNGGRP